jgi:hypothetical protein
VPDHRSVPAAAPLIPFRLLAVISRRARPGVTFAEVWRAVGSEADRLGSTRPSYEQVRVLTHEAIERRLRRRAIAADFLAGAFDPLLVRGYRTMGRAAVAAADEAVDSYRSKRRK